MYSPNNSPRPRLHPLVATAAVAVIVLSAVGVTALVMNHSSATTNPYDAPATASAPASEPMTHVAMAPTPYKAPSSVTAPRTPVYDTPPPIAQAVPACRDCGTVDSIRDIKVKGEGTGVGAVGGAVVGGLLGNLVGAGRGKALATVAGAVGGGLGGNAIEKNVRGEVEHQMVVHLDNGGVRTFTQVSPFPYREGERVRIVEGRVEGV